MRRPRFKYPVKSWNTPHSGVFLREKNACGETPGDFDLSGKELDEETGFYYYGARYLNPKTSVWISADPAMGDYVPRAPASVMRKARQTVSRRRAAPGRARDWRGAKQPRRSRGQSPAKPGLRRFTPQMRPNSEFFTPHTPQYPFFSLFQEILIRGIVRAKEKTTGEQDAL
jgi:RHS repeat-associated protein